MPVPIPTLTKMGEYGADPNILLSILRFTAVFDFSGSPTITLPMGMASDQMPLSMQLVGPHLSEGVLARAAHAFQSTRTGIRGGLRSDEMLCDIRCGGTQPGFATPRGSPANTVG